MKVDVYRCDVCGKEHRDTNYFALDFMRNLCIRDGDRFRDICVNCESKIMDLFKELKEASDETVS